MSAPAPAPTPAVVPPAPAPLPPAPPPRPQAKPAQGAPPVSQRDRLLGAALGFLDALLRGDASDLAAASSLRFSFDGTFVEGRDAQARRWREILAARGQVAEQKLRDLVLLTDEEAIAQLGQPPARLAPLVRPGTWVAVADVSGRPVVLFLVEEGNRVAVAGMHD